MRNVMESRLKKTKLFRSRTTRGFTLLESILVLIIWSTVCCLGFYFTHNNQNRRIEKNFWQEFDQSWMEAKSRANFDRKGTIITFEKKRKQINFVAVGTDKLCQRTIKLPHEWSMPNDDQFSMRYDGYMSPASCVLFGNKGSKYNITVQLGWGEYHVQETATGHVIK